MRGPTSRLAQRRLQGDAGGTTQALADARSHIWEQSQRLAAIRTRRMEQAASARLGGAAMFQRTRPRDRAADARAAAAFGLTGGEICGCGEVGCDSCEVNPSPGCQCAEPACDHWPRETGTRWGGVRTVWKAFTFEPALPVTELMPWICAHSHVTSTGADNSKAQLDLNDRGENHLEGMVIAANPIYDDQFHGGTFEPTDQPFSLAEFNEKTMDFADEDSFFIPYAQVPYYRFVGAPETWDSILDCVSFVYGLFSTAAELDALLDDGFVGVGELLVHGHGLDVTPPSTYAHRDPANVAMICEIAAKHHAPVLVHWDFGTVDDDSSVTAEESYNELVDLLTLYEWGAEVVEEDGSITWHGLKLILGHCGAGPKAAGITELQCDTSTADTYGWRLNQLLKWYPNFYVDIAGMQTSDGVAQLFTSDDPTSKTPLGSLVLALIQAYPRRVLFGIDGTAGDASSANADSVHLYYDFLSQNGIDAVTIRRVMGMNVLVVIEDQPLV